MIDTILFDLDGTLLQFYQDEFIKSYLGKLGKVFIHLGMDAELAIKAVWAGTKAMVLNDGTKTNAERFWRVFADKMDLPDERLNDIENECNDFYAKEFNNVKSVLKTDNLDLPCRMVRTLASKGYTMVLATNPLFPPCAVTTRLGWVNLDPDDFCLITDYSNSSYCKPNHNYYREIFGKIRKEPQQCMMIGNNVKEDMVAGVLGAETFLVTDYLENEDDADISAFRRGTLKELDEYLTALNAI